MKCVLYARVSSKEQEKEGFSIPAQQKLLISYAKQNKFQVAEEFVDVETAKSAGRTNFGKMVEFLRQHSDVRIILVEKTDRLYRNFKDYVLLEELDLEIHLVKENEIISKDSRSHAKFIHGIKVLLAKNYIDNLSEEVKKGMREKAEQGSFPGKAPFGYCNDKSNRTISPDPKFAPLVRRLFELYATGEYSLSMLRDKIYDEGWRSGSDRKLVKSMIEAILKNPFYYGDFLWKDEQYHGDHEPLISHQLYDDVQSILRVKTKPRSGRKEFLFTGILTCQQCGCAFVGEEKKGKYIYYHCTQGRGKCDRRWIREEQLDSQMKAILKAIEITDDTLNDIIKALKDSYGDENVFRQSEIDRLKRRHTELQKRIDKSYEDRLDGLIDEAYWRDLNTKWRTEQDDIASQLDRFSAANRDYVEQAMEILELSKDAYSLYVSQNAEEKRKILKMILSNCTMDGLSLCPTYKKPFDYIAEGLKVQFKLPRQDSNLRPAD